MRDKTVRYGRALPITHQMAGSTCHLAYMAKDQKAGLRAIGSLARAKNAIALPNITH